MGVDGASARDEWSNDRGTASVELRSPSVVVVTATGHLDSTLGKHVIGTVDTLVRDGARHLFFDLEELNDYVTEARLEITRVLLESRSNVLSIHVLARSRIVRLGASVAALVLDGLILYRDRDRFTAALRNALASR
jgi:hypothetical protein